MADVAAVLAEVRDELRGLREFKAHVTRELDELKPKRNKPILHAADSIVLEKSVDGEALKARWGKAKAKTGALTTFGDMQKELTEQRRKAASAGTAVVVGPGEPLWEKESPFVISETNGFRQLWDLLSAVLILYSVALAPMDIAFRPYIEGSYELFVIEVFVDVFFLLDVLSNFFTTYFHNGNEVRSLCKIWRRYSLTWLPIDLVASIPFSFFTLAAGGLGAEAGGGAQALKALKVLKLFKIGRVFRLKKAAKVIEESMPPSLPTGVFGLLGVITCQVFFWHLLLCTYWAVEYEWPASDPLQWVATRGADAGCFRMPRMLLAADVYAHVGHVDSQRLHEAISDARDWSRIDTAQLADWASVLAGGVYAPAAEMALSGGTWDEALELIPPALIDEFALNDTLSSAAALVAECNGLSVHPAAQLASVLSAHVTRLLGLTDVYGVSLLLMMALSVGEVYLPTSAGSLAFIIFALFISIYFETFVIGYVCNVVDQIDEVGKAQRERMLNVRLFLRMRKVDRTTTRKVMTFLDHTWRMYGGTIPDTKELLAQLPHNLQLDLVASADRECVKLMRDLFMPPGGDGASAIDDEQVNTLALTLVMSMKPLVALPDRVRLLQRKGVKVAGLFVIVSGTCLYDTQDADNPVMLMRKGQCFGTELLAHANPQHRVAEAAVTAREICELMYLPAEDFEDLFQSKSPDVQPFIAAFHQLWRSSNAPVRPPPANGPSRGLSTKAMSAISRAAGALSAAPGMNPPLAC